MNLYIDIPSGLMRRARALVGASDYESLNELVVVALENQLTVEGQALAQPGSPVAPQAESATPDALAVLRAPARLGMVKMTTPPAVTRLLWPSTNDESQLYLWGQINRLLPMKVALRVLLQMAADGSDVPVDEFRQKACLAARLAGLQIRDIEKERGVSRNDAHWTALPVGGEVEKSLARCRQHFLLHARSDAVLDGGLARLKFASLENDDRVVRPTEFGLAWGAMPNPVLDRADFSGPSLSADEAAAYVRHVLSSVPEERNPLSETVAFIASGKTTNDLLDRAFADAHSWWTSNMVVTMRAGNLGRLTELGAVTKSGYGGTAAFAVSELGRELFSQVLATGSPS